MPKRINYQVYILDEKHPEFSGRVLYIGTVQECSTFINKKISEMSSLACMLQIDMRGQKEYSGNGAWTTGYHLYWDSSERTHRICIEEYK
jgi:hypothetical protein